MDALYKIASKAEYIMDVARAIAVQREGREVKIVDTAKLNGLLRVLEDVADNLDEYHDWGKEKEK